jgi:hypothetical protein
MRSYDDFGERTFSTSTSFGEGTFSTSTSRVQRGCNWLPYAEQGPSTNVRQTNSSGSGRSSKSSSTTWASLAPDFSCHRFGDHLQGLNVPQAQAVIDNYCNQMANCIEECAVAGRRDEEDNNVMVCDLPVTPKP